MSIDRRKFLAGVALPCRAFAQSPLASPDGLPDVLRRNDGTMVSTAADWSRVRRPEILELFRREMYGRSPERPAKMRFRQWEGPAPALGGLALRKQVSISFTGSDSGPAMDLLLYLPARIKGPVPVILGMNFWGNHAITADTAVRLSRTWMESGRNSFIDLTCVTDHRATESCRAVNAWQWPVEKILQQGYALATFYRGDIDPDRPDGFTESVRALYPELQEGDDNFSAIAAWAWAASRALDYLETDKAVDARRVALFGWSRLGKAALWAGASDERFALVIANESGAGGVKLFRRNVGENIRRLNTVFPHWYCRNFRKYMDRDAALPFDQHMVIACMAPRPVYAGSAERDTLADPPSEFLGLKCAEPVYRLFGKPGLPTDRWPAPEQPVFGQIGYHVRRGVHDVTAFDWQQFLAFASRHL